MANSNINLYFQEPKEEAPQVSFILIYVIAIYTFYNLQG